MKKIVGRVVAEGRVPSPEEFAAAKTALAKELGKDEATLRFKVFQVWDAIKRVVVWRVDTAVGA